MVVVVHALWMTAYGKYFCKLLVIVIVFTLVASCVTCCCNSVIILVNALLPVNLHVLYLC